MIADGLPDRSAYPRGHRRPRIPLGGPLEGDETRSGSFERLFLGVVAHHLDGVTARRKPLDEPQQRRQIASCVEGDRQKTHVSPPFAPPSRKALQALH
jgi:hypothetical protein